MVKRSDASGTIASPTDRDRIRDLRAQHIGRLFQRVHRAFDMRAVEKLQARGHEGLTLAHTALLANLDLEGSRVTTLAERAGMTKQSMGQLARDLEQRGYIVRAPDRADRRAMCVTFTDAGWQFVRDAYEIKQEIEVEYIAILGEGRFEALRSIMTDLLTQRVEQEQ